jgi:hypothetical protein
MSGLLKDQRIRPARLCRDYAATIGTSVLAALHNRAGSLAGGIPTAVIDVA